MHTVGRKETEKALVPLEVLTPDQVKETPTEKPRKKPSRKKAGKALRKLAEKHGQELSTSKLAVKSTLGKFMGGRNGMRDIIVADTLITMDAAQEVLLDLREKLKDQKDINISIRGARAVGEVVGKISTLLGVASDTQEKINEEHKAPKKLAVTPPQLHLHQHVADNQTQQSHRELQEMATSSSSLSTPTHQDEPRNTKSDVSKTKHQDGASPQETQHQQESLNTSPVGQGDTSNREPRRLDREPPPWEVSDEEF